MDTESLLKSLNAHNVRYVVIGATAFPIHGYARATLDVDILIEATIENAQRTHEALSAFGYDLSDVSVEELRTKKVLIRQYLLEVDVWARRVEDRLGSTPASFASLEDLIRMKEAAGRAKDLEDLKYLRRLWEKRQG